MSADRVPEKAERPDEPGAKGKPVLPAPPEPARARGEPEEYRCDLCGAPMKEWHCRIICTFCGYQRDCSDP